MLRLLIIIAVTFFTSSAIAQHIYTKDGVDLGSKRKFVKACADGAQEEYVELNGNKVNFKKLCSCMGDEVIPRITSSELLLAQQQGTFDALMMRDDIYPHIEACAMEHMDELGEVELNSENLEDGSSTEKAFRKSCKDELLNGEEQLFTEEQADFYCDCALNSIREKGYSINDLLMAEDENSEVFNEVVIPCIVETFSEEELMGLAEDVPLYTGEVSFEGGSREVALSEFSGQYKVKISIGGSERYYLLDTGASDVMISVAYAEELMDDGIISEDDQVGTDEYELADGRSVKCPIYLISEMKVGDFVIRDLEVAVLEDGGFLCGMSLLNSFSDWEIDPERNLLILQE